MSNLTYPDPHLFMAGQILALRESFQRISGQLTLIREELGIQDSPPVLEDMETLRKAVTDTLDEWKTKLGSLEQGEEQQRAVCGGHIAFLEDFGQRIPPSDQTAGTQTESVLRDEFANYTSLFPKVPTGVNGPWKALEAVKMEEREATILRFLHKKVAGIPVARIIASHSESGRYWVHRPSKTMGGPVQPIHLLGESRRREAFGFLSLYIWILASIKDERTTSQGMVGACDVSGSIRLVADPAQPNVVTFLGPCPVAKFFEELGYLSIEPEEQTKGVEQGKREKSTKLVTIASGWDKHLYPQLIAAFKDPIHPVVFTHGNLVPENVLCSDDGTICEIIGWENAGWLPRGWEGAVALRDRVSTATDLPTWKAEENRGHWYKFHTYSPLDAFAVFMDEETKDAISRLYELENARLRGRVAPASLRDHFKSPASRHRLQPQSKRRIREYVEAESGARD